MAVDTNPYANVPELDVKARENERRRKIAEAMFEQGNTPVQPFTQAGGVVIPMHWAQGLAQMAKAYVAKKGLQKADKADTALAQQLQQGQAQAVKDYLAKSQGAPEVPAAAAQGPQGPMPSVGPPQPAVQANPRQAVLDLLANKYAPPQAVQAATLGLNLSEGDQARAEDRAWKQQQLAQTLQQRADEAKLRSEDVRYTADQRAEAARQHAELMKQMAEIRAGSGDKPRLGIDQTYNPTTGQAEIIPGSNTWRKQSSLHGKDYEANMALHTKMDLGIKKIDEILDPANKSAFNSNFGGWNAKATQYTPGAAQDMRKTIDSLKSNMKTAGLELIRSGGSIGQMTEREWPIVEQMIDSIDPVLGEKSAREKLNAIKVYFQTLKDKADSAYETEWADSPFYKNRVAPSGGATPSSQSAGAVLKFDAQGNPIQ
jgi:hypothetical protein